MPQGQRLPQRPQPAGLKPVAAATRLPGRDPARRRAGGRRAADRPLSAARLRE